MKRREQRLQKYQIFMHYTGNIGNEPKFKTLQCAFCQKEKPIRDFSEMQQAKASHNLNLPPGAEGSIKVITCINCTEKQVEKLRCRKCHKTMALDKFAKKQRRSVDEARCLACMKKRNEEDVNDSQPEYSSDESYSDSWNDFF